MRLRGVGGVEGAAGSVVAAGGELITGAALTGGALAGTRSQVIGLPPGAPEAAGGDPAAIGDAGPASGRLSALWLRGSEVTVVMPCSLLIESCAASLMCPLMVLNPSSWSSPGNL